ncbi:MAG: hypothetical protein AB8B91_20815 [Rubripirellula sp.]
MKSVLSIRAFAAAAVIATLSVSGLQADAQDSKRDIAKAKPVAHAVASPKVRPLSVTNDLLSSTKIAGTLTDTTTLEMRTSFGSASIPNF